MKTINSIAPAKLSLKDRASFKLISLFIGTFLAVFIGSTVIGAFTSLLENQVAEAELTNQPAVVVIDPKIESNLSKVMSYDSASETVDIKDPFDDPSGLGNNGQTATNAGTTNQTNPTKSASVATTTLAKNNPSKNQTVNTKPNSNVGGVVINAKNDVVTEDTLTRILRREERLRLGQDGGSESAVFAIDDLLPVGMVGGGEGTDEVMFYSQSADRTFSFPVGTQFYDGWLTEIKSEGVVFSLNDQYRTMKLRSWVRSIKSKSAATSAVAVTPDQTTGGND